MTDNIGKTAKTQIKALTETCAQKVEELTQFVGRKHTDMVGRRGPHDGGSIFRMLRLLLG